MTEKAYCYYKCADTGGKRFRGQGLRVSVVDFVQKDPWRPKFIQRFKTDEAFRKSVGYDSGTHGSVEKYIAKYKTGASAPGKNIKQKDLNDFVTSDLYLKGVYVNRAEGKVKSLADGTVNVYKKSELKVWDKQHDAEEVAEDATLINGFSEASLLLLMKRRLIEKFNIYTYVGDIVLALNPYMNFPDMVNIAEYPNQKSYSLGEDPHAYATAHLAYHGQMDRNSSKKTNQSCIVSGESGSGKTVCCSFIMSYLAKLSDWRKMSLHEPVGGDKDITKLVGGVSPFLEAFGNAKTNMNDNSSRFGKFTKIWFNDGKVIGAELEHYLLEKARLVNQGRNERNYHIFYFLLRGMNKEERKAYFENGKSDPHDYPKLMEGWYKNGKKDPDLEDVTLVGHGHGAEFDVNCMNNPLAESPDDTGVRAALGVAGVSEKTQQNMWCIVAGVLRMTAIEFEAEEDDEEKGRVKSTEECERVAELFGFPRDGPDGFGALLCCKIVVFGKKKIRQNQKPSQCADNRNALAKEIYGHLFKWLIQKVCNKKLKPDGGGMDSFVGLLDIFGFENFVPSGGTNSIEQLCINFANEKLQYLFNKHVFDEEKAEYKKDGIDASQMPEGKDNKPCLDLVERKPKKLGQPCGILREVTLISRNPALMNKKNKNVLLVKRWHKRFGMRGPRKDAKERWIRVSSELYKGNLKHDLEFHVVHYAGDIKYSAKDFLDKNIDKLPNQLMKLIESSKFSFLKEIFNDDGDDVGTTKGAKDLCGKYLNQLGELSKTIGATEPHYVRCVKPNSYHFTPIDGRSAFDAYKTYRQLLYAGVMEVVRIKKMGYPFRETFESFWMNRCVANDFHKFLKLSPDIDAKEGAVAVCEAILPKPKTVKDKHSDQEKTQYYWVAANTKIWGKAKTTELLMMWHRTQVAGIVQSWWRCGFMWCRIREMEQATIRLQLRWRHEMLRRKLERMMPDICKAQRVGMASIARTELLKRRARQDAVERCQRFLRGIKIVRYVRQYKYVSTVQKWYRGSHLLHGLRIRQSTLVLQKWYRAVHLLSALRNRHFVISIQDWFRRFHRIQEWYRLSKSLQTTKALATLKCVVRTAKEEVVKLKIVDFMGDLIQNWTAAIKIQRIFRGHLARKRVVHLREMQIRARRNVRLVRAEAMLQMWLRRYQLEKRKNRQHRSMEIVASQYTNWRTRLWWRTLRLAAICIQRRVRGFLARLYAHRRRYLIVKMQASVRIARWLSKFVKKHRRIAKLQSMVRMFLIRRLHRKYKRAARIISKYYIHNRLFPKRLKEWFVKASAATKNDDVEELVALVECVDDRYGARLASVPNLVNMKEPLTYRTLLHMAALSGSYDCARFLLLRGAWPDELDMSRRTPTHVSCGEGDRNRRITVLLLEDWCRHGPSFYSFDEEAPRLYAPNAWRSFARAVSDRSEKFSRPKDVLTMKDATGLTPLELALYSEEEYERTFVLLKKLGAEADNTAIDETKKQHTMQLQTTALFKSRVGRDTIRRRELERADPVNRLMTLMRDEIAHPGVRLDPMTERMQIQRKKRAAQTILRYWRAYVLRRFAIIQGRKRLAEKRVIAIAHDASKYAAADGPERDARLMSILVNTKCLIYLPKMKGLGLKNFQDLAALSNDELDIVCNRVDMLLIDKLRLKRAIAHRTGRSKVATWASSATTTETTTTTTLRADEGTKSRGAAAQRKALEMLERMKTERKMAGVAGAGDEKRNEDVAPTRSMADRVEEAIRELNLDKIVSGKNTSEQPPPSPPGMAADHSSTALATSGNLINPDVLENGRHALASMRNILSVLSTPPADRGWYYLDRKKLVQGPYPRRAMRTWFEQGHLKETLPIRFGRQGPFQALCDRFFPPMSAFRDFGDSKGTLRALRDELREAMRR
eukprot:g1014.t1